MVKEIAMFMMILSLSNSVTEDEDITTCNPFNMNSEMTIMQKIEREKGDTKCKDHLSEPRKY